MGARGEVVPSVVPWADLSNAQAWLYGYVRTDVPGYREIEKFGALTVVAAAEYRFDALVAELAGLTLEQELTGQITTDTDRMTPRDRLGWLLGWGVEPGTEVADSFPYIPPAGIPLLGATWTAIETDEDRRIVIDKYKRNQGYVWGGASIFQCKLDMHRWSLEALQTGWCLRGKVTLGCADMIDTPISSSEPRGAITGYALGLGSVSWLDSIQQTARVEMAIVVD